MREVSCDRWSAALNSASPTAAFDMTPWMKPVPSRRMRKWIFPLDRRFLEHPLGVAACAPALSAASVEIEGSLSAHLPCASAHRTDASIDPPLAPPEPT